jgi:hypothetical protein
MTTFDDRERQFEAKFQHDQELQFKVTVRRNRLLGEWAGSLMGLEGDALATYAKEVVQSDLNHPGTNEAFAKVRDDLAAKGVTMSDHMLHKQMGQLMAQAKQQVMGE